MQGLHNQKYQVFNSKNLVCGFKHDCLRLFIAVYPIYVVPNYYNPLQKHRRTYSFNHFLSFRSSGHVGQSRNVSFSRISIGKVYSLVIV